MFVDYETGVDLLPRQYPWVDVANCQNDNYRNFVHHPELVLTALVLDRM